MQKAKCTAIVLAAGQGKRMGTNIQKQYLELDGKPILYYSLYAFEKSKLIDEIILVVGENQIEYCRKEIVSKYQFSKVKHIIQGGETGLEAGGRVEILSGLTEGERVIIE